VDIKMSVWDKRCMGKEWIKVALDMVILWIFYNEWMWPLDATVWINYSISCKTVYYSMKTSRSCNHQFIVHLPIYLSTKLLC
jgi:hypothetical protein